MKKYQKTPTGSILVPLYNKGALVEMTTTDYKKLKSEIKNPAFAKTKTYRTLTTTMRKAFWLAGIKAIYTPRGVYVMF